MFEVMSTLVAVCGDMTPDVCVGHWGHGLVLCVAGPGSRAASASVCQVCTKAGGERGAQPAKTY